MDNIRIGEVTQIFPEEGKVKVCYEDDDNASCKLPLLMFNGEYLMPEVGDTVLTIHRPSGSSEGFVIGKYYSEDNEVKADLEEGEIFRKDITEDTFISVNEENLTKIETKRFQLKGEDTEFQLDKEKKSHLKADDLLIQSKSGTLEIKADGNMKVCSKEKLDISCEGNVDTDISGNMNLTADGMANITGSGIGLKSSGDIDLTGSFGSTSVSELIQRITALEQALQNMS